MWETEGKTEGEREREARERCRRPLSLEQGPICQGQLDVLEATCGGVCTAHQQTSTWWAPRLFGAVCQEQWGHGNHRAGTACRWCAKTCPTYAHGRRTPDRHRSQHYLDRCDGHGGAARLGLLQTACEKPEQHKSREHGLGVPNPAVLHQGLVPFVIEQRGRPASCAQASGGLPHIEEGQAHWKHLGPGHGCC